ncbi:SDR family NAD(P)-dependent oxidoreductase [Pedobacter cryoconitis]|uniref:NAD(P)-dependent dehydrogenase (Short-subunit alcohol dehydrogenase family) n=1 Tax=Pedobacter cryoconitis TaxID=188932 RepID=A0A7X0J054_9SPHI|nr:SDR family NAD(P)-dependent oxidoreductase [Pedobacter cryoconitis]MBB6498621.1 NAD(P)-dependent dehydrogenase (short-subunit alcohol dehydrogenase family) [Pedobacter cryoconitis]
MKLKNKITIVTGGNSGIGFGIANAFRSEGAVGTITGRNKKTLDSAVEQLGNDSIGLAGDVTKADDLKSVYLRVKKLRLYHLQEGFRWIYYPEKSE